MNIQPVDVSVKINNIFDNNKLTDLEVFINKRKYLNSCNVILIYLFHIIQTSGLLVTMIGTNYEYKYLIYIGISLNATASLLHAFKKVNTDISIKLLHDIEKIKNNTYVSQSVIIEEDRKNQSEDTFLLKTPNVDYSNFQKS